MPPRIADYTFNKVPAPLRSPVGYRGIYREVGEANRRYCRRSLLRVVWGALSCFRAVPPVAISFLRRAAAHYN
jgi:hypothetical protein